ncbi:hypothetical protein, partial [Microbacterium fluvii]|uniref:hypothetical protein n=1 Tax=Microbacterium fluvii TaxID=415215 RepID=UPI0031E50346
MTPEQGEPDDDTVLSRRRADAAPHGADDLDATALRRAQRGPAPEPPADEPHPDGDFDLTLLPEWLG